MKHLSRDELLKIGASLEDYHSVFFVFWELAAVYFTDAIPTAAIRFNVDNRKPEMLLNEAFWNRHNFLEKLFIVCHECMHIFLDHGIRNGMKIPGATPALVNKAQDITINHIIVDLFGYNRDDLREWRKYCWIETCFTNPVLIKRNETFIYYLEELIKDPKSKEDGGPAPLDSHADPEKMTEAEKKVQEDIAKSVAENFSADEIEKIANTIPDEAGTDGNGAGSVRGAYEAILEKKIKKLRLNITKMIKKLKKTSIKYELRDQETFTQTNRRFDDVIYRSNVSLPGNREVEGIQKGRLLTALYMDVSGSCMAFFKLFQQVAAAFDDEREILDLRTFIFDTSVVEITDKSSIRVGGGTAFDIIERKNLELEAEYHRYPDCTIVVTDGDGGPVKPKSPGKWVWLLTPPGNKQYIHSKSRHWLITEVEF